jgi:NADH dehydrogenase
MLRIKEEPEEVGAGIVVWSTGLMQNPLVTKLLETDVPGVGRIAKNPRTGGIVTNSNLQVQLLRPGADAETVSSADSASTTTLKDVYAVGDCISVQGENYPATAQVASQQAVYLGKQLNRGDQQALKPFRFKNWGVMTYLGGWRAIHQSDADNLTGWAAWVLWRTAYLTRSMSVRNKIMIPVYWVITWIFGRDISRF